MTVHLSLGDDTVTGNESSDFWAPRKLAEHQHFSTEMKTPECADKMLHADYPKEGTTRRDRRNQNEHFHLSTHLNEIPTSFTCSDLLTWRQLYAWKSHLTLRRKIAKVAKAKHGFKENISKCDFLHSSVCLSCSICIEWSHSTSFELPQQSWRADVKMLVAWVCWCQTRLNAAPVSSFPAN